MKACLHVLVILIIAGFASAAEDMSAVPVEKLIDELTQIDSQAPGLHGAASVRGFIGEDKPLQFAGGILGSAAPVVPPAMRELVRRGVKALPLLIGHLGDTRPTRLTVAKDIFLSRLYSDEYDPRFRQTQAYYIPEGLQDKYFDGGYTVKVGDVCYFIIGQIVGRNLLPVRYQPTAVVIINSPIEAPNLIDRVKKDWSGLDEKAHKASLMADAQWGQHIWVFGPALVRLRFYYPAEYARASVANDLKKHIEEFEADENKANTKSNLHLSK